MCGKDDPILTPPYIAPGSPPHVRERLKTRIKTLIAVRITPACAGKTPVRPCTAFTVLDHPRMCGKDILHGPGRDARQGSPPHVRERLPREGVTTMNFGSPPHVRERPIMSAQKPSKGGITPACAGKTRHSR